MGPSAALLPAAPPPPLLLLPAGRAEAGCAHGGHLAAAAIWPAHYLNHIGRGDVAGIPRCDGAGAARRPAATRSPRRDGRVAASGAKRSQGSVLRGAVRWCLLCECVEVALSRGA